MEITSQALRVHSSFELPKDPLLPTLSTNFIYQPLQLVKKMTSRHSDSHNIKALESTAGLSPIFPEKSFKPSILKDLLVPESSETKCEFLIVVAMYNESAEHFTNTISGITENLDVFSAAGVGPEKLACVVIVDGMKPFLETYQKQSQFFSQFFCEQSIKTRFNVQSLLECKIPDQIDSDEFAHCFMGDVIFGKSELPLKMIFCVKQYNRRKLNTHLWFFGGFCEMIQPKFVMLLDVGTKPLARSLFYLYEAMNCNKQLAGCCGEIKPMVYDVWKIVVPAQFVEYKFSHMLDKALESVIGYITVLPGAFSAYRWEALQGGPLWDDYFKSICHPELMNAFQSNIYLAEDRVLCLSLVTKQYHKYTLRYVKSSVAETDVPESISILMAQRRRWINGSWFALVDALKKFTNVYSSNHHCCRKLLFSFQMIYYLFNVIYTWFIVGLFMLALSITISKSYEQENFNPLIGQIMIIVYITLILVIFITSLGVKPKRVEDFFKALSVLLGLFQCYIIYLTVSFLYNLDYTHNPKQILVGVGSTAGLFAFVVILNCEIVTVLKGVFHYIFLIPTYINIFFIYSICNVHDCTWGNRPDSLTAEEKNRIEEFEEFRTRWVIFWALCNSGLAYAIFWVYSTTQNFGYYFISGITITGISIIILRAFGGIVYVFVECCQGKMKVNEGKLEENQKKRRKTALRISPDQAGNIEDNSFVENDKERMSMATVIQVNDRQILSAKTNSVENDLREDGKGDESERLRQERKIRKEEKRKKREEREERKRRKEEKRSKISKRESIERAQQNEVTVSRSLPALSPDRTKSSRSKDLIGLDKIVEKIEEENKKDL